MRQRENLLTGGENLVDLRRTDRFEQRIDPASRITPRRPEDARMRERNRSTGLKASGVNPRR